MTDAKVKVFFSYSHEDESLRDELAKHLKPLERQNKIETWHDRKIDPGTDWRKELDGQLNSADIILLLVSPSFVDSDFCYCTELEQARERHDAGEARIIPIFLRPLDIEALEGTPLQTLKGLPEPSQPITKWENRDEAYVEVAKGIRAVVNKIQQEKEIKQAAQSRELTRQSPMRSRVPDEHYIERDEAKRLLDRFERVLQQPDGQPLLFNICGIGGVGKTTLLGRLREAHTGNVDFLEVCFAKTVDIETPLKLMRKVHQQARELLGTETSIDAFTQREQLFENTLFELSHRSVDGKEASSEDARKITSWFERFIWLGTASFASTSNHPKFYGAEFAPSGAIGEDAEGLKEWIQQRVRNHPATKDQPELQALMLEPVSQLTQAFAESLMQVAQLRAQSLVLILDTYEKAQAYLNQWLWQYLVEDTPLASSPVRLVVVGRRSLQADEGWRKLNQDRTLLHTTPLQEFSKNDTENYLKQIGIQNGGTRAKIYRATQGLPYYLDWVRKQQEDDKEPDFSKGNQAIAELLLQGTDSQQRKILQIVACCRWFDLAIMRYLLECNIPGLQQANDTAEDYFEWLKRSDFVEFSKGHYRLDDVARDVFRWSYFQDDQNQFRKTNALLADYFKRQADELVEPQTPLPDSYEDEEWRELIAEFLYYSLFGKGREGLHQYTEQVFIAAYLREPDVFIAPFAFISAELSEESQTLLPRATGKFFKDSAIALRFGWIFLGQPPKSYKLEFEGEDDLSEDAIEARLKNIEDALQVLLEQVDNVPDGLGKCVGLIYKSLRRKRSREMVNSLLPAKSQAEQLATQCRPKLLHSLFLNLGDLLNTIERYQDALDCCEIALDLWEGNPQTFLTKGVALGNLERHEEALESFQKLIDLDSKSVDAWRNRGFALYHLERHEEALESFQKLIDLDSKSVDAWRNRGFALYHLERYEEALESFQKALDLDPKSVNAWINRGDVLRALKRYGEALAAFDRALEIAPKNSGVLNSQALTLSFLQDFDKAIAAVDQAIHLSPEEALLKANRGIVLARAGRYAEALTDCDQAIQQDPKHESGYYAKACCYALQGELEPIIDNLTKAIEIAPRHSRREAKCNPDFDRIRDDERFRALVYLE
ncbi:tetratricopeptide repeat protein [Nodosilinea sp. LEGE 07298]|uniref:tetratricopeptide repeat protein n=1 Tax=Nodosilinea sp. LEGE 07298 TaxID=2777970 RepID=UPI0018830FC2|nr:tetratricopeptide repeat protein [Nodosilinea sp. LEGE 07298]MBE9112243.1 tetratricopeptide repeat protein [Nodosilinea sp. LEGE 07298]